MSVVCYQVEVSATGRSLVPRSPIDCGVYESDREASVKKEGLIHWGLLGRGEAGPRNVVYTL